MRKKLVIVSTGLNNGGAERVLFNFLAHIPDEQRRRIILVSCGGQQYYLSKLKNINNLTIITLDLKNPYGVLRLFKLIIMLFREKHESNSLQFLGWMYHGSLVAYILSRILKGDKLYWSFRQTLENIKQEKQSLRYLIFILKKLSSKCNLLIFNSHVSRASHLEYGFECDTCVVDNGFNLNDFDGRTETIENSDELRERKFIFVGRNHPQKDIAGLLKAFDIVWNKGYQSSLTIVSPDDSTKDLISESKVEKNFPNRVTFIGEQTMMSEVYPDFHFICLKSVNREAFPNVIAEGMLSGCVPVVTDVGDTARIVSTFGFVSNDTDIISYSDLLCSAHELQFEEFLSLSKLGSESIRQRFALEKMVENFQVKLELN